MRTRVHHRSDGRMLETPVDRHPSRRTRMVRYFWGNRFPRNVGKGGFVRFLRGTNLFGSKGSLEIRFLSNSLEVRKPVSPIKAAATPSGWLYAPETLSEISMTPEQLLRS